MTVIEPVCYHGLIQPVNHYYNILRYVLCNTPKPNTLKIYLPGWLIILFKSNSAWNRVCWSIHCCEICPKNSIWLWQIQAVCMQRGYSVQHYSGKKGDWERVAADNYKSKHTWWPFRPKVFLISQMWSTLPGVFLSPSMWWIASLPSGCLWQWWWSVKQVSAAHFVTLLSRWFGDSPRQRYGAYSTPVDHETAKFALKAAGIPLRKQSGLSNLRI